MRVRISIIVLLLCAAFLSPAITEAKGKKASEEKQYRLSQKKMTLQLGNQAYLDMLCTDSEGNTDYVYDCIYSSSDETVVTVNEYGSIEAVGLGKAVITVGHGEAKFKCKITVKESRYRPDRTEIKTKTFSDEYLKISNYTDCLYADFSVIEILEDNTELERYDSIDFTRTSDEGDYLICARKPGRYKIYLEVYADDGQFGVNCFKSVYMVEAELHGLCDSSFACAIGTEWQLTYGDLDNISFSVEDEGMASVSADGAVTGISEGYTTITMSGYNEEGIQESYFCYVYVTDPEVIFDREYVRKGEYLWPDIDNIADDSIVTYETSDSEVISVEHGDPWATGVGKAKLYVTVDGKKFTISIEVVDLNIVTDCFLLATKEQQKVEITGLSRKLKKKPVKYEVGDKKLVSVSEDGVITAKKKGNTTIKVTIADFVLEAGISVGSKKAVQAVKNAQEVLGAEYSQAKRMSEGFYDCSSLAWRSYQPCGIDFGSKTYAPTAAGIAEYMEKNNKVIADEYVDMTELLPGDLIFYTSGENGRYKNIGHVSIFSGVTINTDPYYMYYYDADDYYYYYDSYNGRITHAVSSGVTNSVYADNYGTIVMIARPTKK